MHCLSTAASPPGAHHPLKAPPSCSTMHAISMEASLPGMPPSAPAWRWCSEMPSNSTATCPLGMWHKPSAFTWCLMAHLPLIKTCLHGQSAPQLMFVACCVDLQSHLCTCHQPSCHKLAISALSATLICTPILTLTDWLILDLTNQFLMEATNRSLSTIFLLGHEFTI